MSSKYVLTYQDGSLEVSSVSLRNVTMTSGNIDATLALFQAVKDAIADVTEAGLKKELVVASETKLSPTPGGNRELKWLVSMIDAEGDPVTLEIPAADDSLRLAGTDLMDPDSTEYAALVSALEAGHLSKAGEAVTVQQIKIVGRNL